jgi:hypothetical protein
MINNSTHEVNTTTPISIGFIDHSIFTSPKCVRITKEAEI